MTVSNKKRTKITEASVNLTGLLDVFISLTSTQAATLLASFSHIGVIPTFGLGCIFSAVG